MNVKNFIQKIKGPRELALALLALVFLFSFAAFLARKPGFRYTFRFQSVDSGKNNIEWRYLPYRRGRERVVLYAEELLLGPKTERSRPIFSPGTKLDFCFEREKTLYVGLTPALLEKTGNASEIMEGIELFKKNIRNSFPKYKKIELFIDKKGLVQD